MNILILGDIVGPSGRDALNKNLSSIIKKKNIKFTIIYGVYSDDSGVGITKENTNNLYEFEESNLRIFGIDYMGYIKFKHKHNHTLRNSEKGIQTDPHLTISEKTSEIYS